MTDWLDRTKMLLGEEAMQKLASSKVAIFGIGGVGGFVCEGLVRSGVGAFDIIDRDKIEETNINRQIIALNSNVGESKVSVMKSRMLDINPKARVRALEVFFLPESSGDFDFTEYDYVVDAVDTVTAKLVIISRAYEAGVPVISAMGAGNKLNPGAFRVADIYDTKICPLARVMRRELKKRGVEKLKVVYSEEEPVKSREDHPGSCAFVPSVAGLLMASEVVRDLIK